MSALSRAFESLARAKQAASDGADDAVILDGQRIKTALVEEIGTDEALLSGGIGEGGQFRVQIPVSELADPPAKFAEIEVRGKSLQVLSFIERNGVTYEITAGDPVAEG